MLKYIINSQPSASHSSDVEVKLNKKAIPWTNMKWLFAKGLKAEMIISFLLA
ncbi:hypothetical protein [Flammeovirga sp. EKP202]|uniref:hypothetical protein n=1 Tax=Flammeovirga sp. EKP202 TaxID=2770592 RepID=UPI00165F61D3|nr:hypothetical protein [Flammeovirga sp. EKP202]MBD0402857.1 hypothetical protein [Flammeovirga sp. EKP202]